MLGSQARDNRLQRRRGQIPGLALSIGLEDTKFVFRNMCDNKRPLVIVTHSWQEDSFFHENRKKRIPDDHYHQSVCRASGIRGTEPGAYSPGDGGTPIPAPN